MAHRLEPAERPGAPGRRGLACELGLIAASAYAGAIGLMGRGIDLGEPVSSRLPFRSYPLAGAALVAAVAVPMTVASAEAWRGGRLADGAVVVAGSMLVGWIAVELAFIRSFSWLHPLYALAGAAVVATGVHHWNTDRGPGGGTGL